MNNLFTSYTAIFLLTLPSPTLFLHTKAAEEDRTVADSQFTSSGFRPNKPLDQPFSIVSFRGLPRNGSLSRVYVDEHGFIQLPPGRAEGSSLYDQRDLTEEELKKYQYVISKDQESGQPLFHFNIDSAPLVPLVFSITFSFNQYNDVPYSSNKYSPIINSSKAQDIQISLYKENATFPEIISELEHQSGCLILYEEMPPTITRCE